MVEEGLEGRVEAWIADDPDPGDRAELETLLARAYGTEADAATAELRDRFAGRLTFGTAGLRGAVAAGPNRMNRAVVRAATAALAGWLTDRDPGAASAGVVIGCDARHGSAEFADEAARVLAGAGLRVHLLPRPCPTPLLAFAVRQLSAAAGIMITASHNPAADNGYKLYLADGAQIIPPADTEIEAAIRSLGALREVPVGSLDGPLVTRHGDQIAAAYLSAVTAAAGTPRDTGTAPPSGAVTAAAGTPRDTGTAPPSGAATAAAGTPRDTGTAPPSGAVTAAAGTPRYTGTAPQSGAAP